MGSREPSLIGVAEVGRALGVSLSTVWRMIRRGDLPSVRKGGRRLVPASALRRQAARREIQKIKPFTKDHPMWRLIGAFSSGGEGPGSSDKHAILDSEPCGRR